MHKEELETPVLAVDLDALEANMAKMAVFFAQAPAKLRPHVKTHKTPALAKKQIEAGAAGICCGNLREAEVMIDAGLLDVLVTREVVSPAEIQRTAALAQRSQLMIVVDDEEVMARLSSEAMRAGVKIRTLVDVDVRLGRAGAAPGEAARRLAHKVDELPGLAFWGLMGYEGSLHQVESAARTQMCREALAKLVETKELIERDGLEVRAASAGATSTFRLTGCYPGVTEVQAGSYLTFDAKNRRTSQDFETALRVLTTVVSRPSRVRVTVDAGQKKVSGEGGLPEVHGMSGLQVAALNEEHGILELSEPAREVRVGDRLELIPYQGGLTINLHDRMYGLRGDRVEEIYEIAARGA